MTGIESGSYTGRGDLTDQGEKNIKNFEKLLEFSGAIRYTKKAVA